MKNYEYGQSRSYKYQDAIRQSTYSEADWQIISILSPIQPIIEQKIRDDLYLLDNELQRIMWSHIETDLSKMQKAVCKLYRLALAQEGQEWIAKQLGVNQSTIVKTITGTPNPKRPNNTSGIRRKLIIAIRNDRQAQDIICQMTDMGAEDISPRDIPHWACFHRL